MPRRGAYAAPAQPAAAIQAGNAPRWIADRLLPGACNAHCLAANLIEHRSRGERRAFDIEFELGERRKAYCPAAKIAPAGIPPSERDSKRFPADVRIYGHLDSPTRPPRLQRRSFARHHTHGTGCFATGVAASR